MTTEDDFQASLDADPGNGLLRLLLADWLDENARGVECERCGGCGHESAYCTTACPGCCPHCRGTGTVSDGRRERAAGYRALGELGRVPLRTRRGVWGWYRSSHYERVETSPDSNLPDDWFVAVAGGTPFRSEGDCWCREYPTRREADDAAAEAFGRLPADVQARILAGVTA